MTYDSNLREEELKNKVAHDFFAEYDTTKIIGNIDFCIAVPDRGLFETESLLWAESKSGTKHDIYESFVQLIITIGKARTFDKHLPPAFLGAFDADKIAFISYNEVLDIFYQNDFNWNITPSDHSTKEFAQVLAAVEAILNKEACIYKFGTDSKELKNFIKKNFIVGKSKLSKVQVTKNNFISIYQKWCDEVKPTITVKWNIAKKNDIFDADFYLADLLSEHNITLKEKLFVLLRKNYYELDRRINESGMFDSSQAQFTDDMVKHTQFWNRYNRPPKREYWDYIVERRDLLVPQDIRERKGSYFTPQRWVELSQQYLAEELGEDWQDRYYVWDCCAGTGNLLAGLTNKYNIWASTLDKSDVDIMHDRIKNGANLLDNHIFQFDFLNDSFDKLPKELWRIINNETERRKLVIYINPPYAEATTATTVTRTGKNKAKVATSNLMSEKYKVLIKNAANELFALFFIRIYQEIPSCTLAEFSTLKILQASNFVDFRKIFRAKLKKFFIVPADSFDNVKGKFPIGFFIWDTTTPNTITKEIADVYLSDGTSSNQKKFYGKLPPSINKWIKTFDQATEDIIGYMENPTPDFQNNKYLCITNKAGTRHNNYFAINKTTLAVTSVYFSVRECIEPTWINDRDQFLTPDHNWDKDYEFLNDCLVFTLFHGQNRIMSHIGTNHWIPFTEKEVDAKEKFESHFMADYIAGKITQTQYTDNDLFSPKIERGGDFRSPNRFNFP